MKKNLMVKIFTAILTFVMAVGLMITATGCNKQPDNGGSTTTDTPIERDTNTIITSEGYEEGTVLPKAQAPKETINYIDLRNSNNNDIFLGVALQGIVNKQSPSIYVLSNSLVEGTENTVYWLNKLDVTYPGVYTKNEYTDLYKLVQDNYDSIDGYILYDARLCDGKMRSRNYYGALYGDMACLDLTIMLSSIHNAIPLTQAQYTTLVNKYDFDKPMLGDTTYFMEKDEDGKILRTDAARGSRAVWAKVFNYVINKLGDKLSDVAFAHCPAFCIASADYWIQNNLLVYSRILNRDATAEEMEIESKLLALTKDNAVSLGVWYLQNDEGGYVAKLSQSKKVMVVTYETYNLSWTSGLANVYPERCEIRDLEPEEGKIYLSFDLSEGDNVSYESFRLNSIMDAANENTIMGWTFSPVLGEIAPNMMSYFNTKLGNNYSIVTPEQGFAYVSSTPEHDSFYGYTAEYLKRTNSDGIRILGNDMISTFKYAEKLEDLNAIFIGYMGEGTKYWNNNEEANILYNDTVFFRHYDGRAMSEIASYNGTEPAFFSVSLLGWGQDANTVDAITKNLDDRFVVVSPSELASLYKKYVSSRFNNVAFADFDADGLQGEMGFLTYATNHANVSSEDAIRYLDGNESAIYKFDLADDVTKANIQFRIGGRFVIEASTNRTTWYQIAESDKYYEESTYVNCDLTKYLENNAGKTVYIRIADPTTENGNGALLEHVTVYTDKMDFDTVTINAEDDAAFLYENEESTVGWGARTGKFTYSVDLKNGAQVAELSVVMTEDTTAEISVDGKAFAPITFSGKTKTTYFADISTLLGGNNNVKLRFDGEVTTVKITLTEAVKELSFTPIGLTAEDDYAISLDDMEVKAENTVNSYLEIVKKEQAIYKFVLDENVTSLRLDLGILGNYKVEVSNDGKTYQQALIAQIGGGAQVKYVYTDISYVLTAGKTIYVRFSVIDPTSDKSVRLFGIRLFTNLASQQMIDRYENERLPDLSVVPSWDGTNREGNINYGNDDENSVEYKLLDTELSAASIYMHNYVLPLRTVVNSRSCFVYKLDFSEENIAFWQELLPELFVEGFELTKLRIGIVIAEGYLISSSADAEDWKTEIIATVDETYTGGASNKTTETVILNDYLDAGEDCIYLKFEDNTPTTGWGPLVFELKFYFN